MLPAVRSGVRSGGGVTTAFGTDTRATAADPVDSIEVRAAGTGAAGSGCAGTGSGWAGGSGGEYAGSGRDSAAGGSGSAKGAGGSGSMNGAGGSGSVNGAGGGLGGCRWSGVRAPQVRRGRAAGRRLGSIEAARAPAAQS